VIFPSGPTMPRIRGSVTAALTMAGLLWMLTACASSQAAAHKVPPAAVGSTCRQVSAVLSDGPDPDADPVGYAEAQILPLGQIHSSNRPLGAAITRLARAYREFFASNGTAGKTAVANASKQVNAFCPGAAS
jgi:hypothetical protein